MSCVHILEIKPLSVTSFANIFSHSRLSFCSVYGFLRSAKLVSLIRSHLFIFAFISTALKDCSKKTMVQFISENVLPMFSSGSSMVLCLILKSLSHLKFIFVYGMRECSNFIDLYAVIQLSPHHLLKRFSFPHCIFLPALLKIN